MSRRCSSPSPTSPKPSRTPCSPPASTRTGYLGRLPIDKIKIDQRFVRGLPADAESAAIVTSVLTLSRALGKTTVAEGIETSAQADHLRHAGCTEGQGFHFGRPMSGTAFVELASGRDTAVSA